MLAIKEAASDMSPYVRKTAAHAIPKLYRYTRSPHPPLASPKSCRLLLVLFLVFLFCFVLFFSSDGSRQFGELTEMEDIEGSGSHLFMNRVGVREVSTAWADVGKAGDGGGAIPLNSFSLSLDSDQKDQLIEVIEKLLADKTTVRMWTHRDGW